MSSDDGVGDMEDLSAAEHFRGEGGGRKWVLSLPKGDMLYNIRCFLFFCLAGLSKKYWKTFSDAR